MAYNICLICAAFLFAVVVSCAVDSLLKKYLLGLPVLLLIFCCGSATAQQTIFNVPSPDTTAPGKVFVQHESQFRAWNPDAFWLGTHYLAVGAGHDLEIDATLSNVRAPNAGSPVLALGIKKGFSLFNNRLRNRELRLVVGQMIPISLGQGGVGNWSYATVSGRLPYLKTRISGGYSTGTKQLFGRTTVGFIGTYEQPVTRNFSLIGDWYSGTHSNGLFIPGFSYSFPKQVALYTGYQIPNNRACGPSGFVIELAKTF
jgi:hypothetical protein